MAEGFNSALRTFAGLAFAAGTVLGLGGTAQAQPFFGFFTRGFSAPATLPPEAIYNHLVRYGYQPLGRIQRNGRVFVADVIDPRRRQLRLVINSADGAVLERYVIASRYGAVDEPRPAAPLQPEVRAPLKQKPEPRVATREPPQERVTEQPRAPVTVAPKVIRAPVPEPRSVRAPAPTHKEPAVAEVPAAAAEPPAPAPAPVVTPRREAAPARPVAPRTEGPGYANGVPINPLD